jgi:hypothetical protein
VNQEFDHRSKNASSKYLDNNKKSGKNNKKSGENNKKNLGGKTII